MICRKGSQGHCISCQFCERPMGGWLFTTKNKNYTAIAHNLSGYDGLYVMNYLIQSGLKFTFMLQGSKVIYIEVNSRLTIRLIDSCNFLPMKLKDLLAAFDLDDIKGEFPHFWNTKEHQNYIGAYPPPEMYGSESMNTNDRLKFLAWYAEKEKNIFDFRKEMDEYCRADVVTLICRD